jgi:hypothetical protein
VDLGRCSALELRQLQSFLGACHDAPPNGKDGGGGATATEGQQLGQGNAATAGGGREVSGFPAGLLRDHSLSEHAGVVWPGVLVGAGGLPGGLLWATRRRAGPAEPRLILIGALLRPVTATLPALGVARNSATKLFVASTQTPLISRSRCSSGLKARSVTLLPGGPRVDDPPPTAPAGAARGSKADPGGAVGGTPALGLPPSKASAARRFSGRAGSWARRVCFSNQHGSAHL